MVGAFLVYSCGSDGLPFSLLSFVYLFVSRSSYLVERISVCMAVLERPKMVNNVLGSSPCNTYVLSIDVNCNNQGCLQGLCHNSRLFTSFWVALVFYHVPHESPFLNKDFQSSNSLLSNKSFFFFHEGKFVCFVQQSPKITNFQMCIFLGVWSSCELTNFGGKFGAFGIISKIMRMTRQIWVCYLFDNCINGD